MGKVKKAFGAFLVPLLSVLLAFLIGGIIMAALGANPFLAVKFLFQGAFGSKAGIGTTLTQAMPGVLEAKIDHVILRSDEITIQVKLKAVTT